MKWHWVLMVVGIAGVVVGGLDLAATFGGALQLPFKSLVCVPLALTLASLERIGRQHDRACRILLFLLTVVNFAIGMVGAFVTALMASMCCS